MKSKAILSICLTLLALAFVVNTVSATDFGCDVDDFVCLTGVEVDNIEYKVGQTTLAGETSNTIEVEVFFTAMDDVNDVKLKVYIDDYKAEISDSTGFFHIVEGSTYKKKFLLTLPSSADLDGLTEELNLLVRFTAKGEASSPLEWSTDVTMQRESYGLHILSIDSPSTVSAGSTIAVDVVVENNGHNRLENVYVKASIPELGIQKKVYAGDLESEDAIKKYQNLCNNDPDACSWNMFKDFDEDETVVKRIYLTVPANAAAGSYDIEVEAYNVDTAVVAKDKIVVEAVQTGVISPAGAKTIAPGEETTFSIVLVNPSETIAVYTVTPVETPGLIVEILESTVVVGAEDSKTVLVKVRATDSADEGTRVVTLNVNDQNGLVATKQLTVNVDEESASVVKNDAVFILTVVLVIVFVVLLIILLVLLTKKPTEAEEFGETSYY